MSVDLPMPGRAADQDERARHQSAAEHAVELADAGAHARDRAAASTSASVTGRTALPERRRPPARGAAARCSSTSVFHSPQPGQRPCHLGLSCPQAEQAKRVLERAIPARLSARVDGFAPPAQDLFSIRLAGVACIGSVELLEQPVAGVEFVALDTETNGLGGELCELTEVGAVLVGGGELHETFDSLVRPGRPLSRGIQRFTGITQGMVDGAPPPEEVLPEVARLLEGRVLVAHNASFDRRVLRQAFERVGIDWPDPPGPVHGPARAEVRSAGAPAGPRPARGGPRHRGQ